MPNKSASKVNPQPENGHTDIANEIVEQFAQHRISGEEWQVLWVILRKTWGWHKKTDKIRTDKFSEITGINKSNVVRAITKLTAKNVIKKDNSNPPTYSFNKHYDTWKMEPKKVRGLAKVYGIRMEDVKKEILKRDKNACRLCNNTETILVHHIDYNQTNWDRNNLITLCRGCHLKTIHNQEIWQQKFISIIKKDNNKKTTQKKQGVMGVVNFDNPSIVIKKDNSVVQKDNSAPHKSLSPSELQMPKETINKETRSSKETINKETKHKPKHSGQKPAHKKESQKVLQIHQFLVERFKKLYQDKYHAPYVETKKDFIMAARLLKKVDLEEAERRLNNAFIYKYWFDVKTFGQFSAHFNDLTEQPKDKYSGIREWLTEKEQEVQNEQERL